MSNVIIYDTYNVNVTIENDEVVGVQVVDGFIHDVIAGTNISIDKSDPLNPVISSSSGGGGTWGSITGTLSSQTDLQNALDAKADDLTNGNGTTANGSSVDFGGPLTGNTSITGTTQTFEINMSDSGKTNEIYIDNLDLILSSLNGGISTSINTNTNGEVGLTSIWATGQSYFFTDPTNGFNLSYQEGLNGSYLTLLPTVISLNSDTIKLKTSSTIGYVWTASGTDGSGGWAALAADALSSITAATGNATINNAANAIEWQWNSLAAGTGLLLSSSSTAAASNTNTLFRVNQTGANATSTQTTHSGYFSNTKTGTSSTNVALYSTASGGTNNYSFQGVGSMTITGGSGLAPIYVRANAAAQGIELSSDGFQFRGLVDANTGLGSGSKRWGNSYFLAAYIGNASPAAGEIFYTSPNVPRTGLTAESIFNRLSSAASVSYTLNGTIATQRYNLINAPTAIIGSVATTTLTNAYNFWVEDLPTAGANAAITNKWCVGFAGNVKIDGTRVNIVNLPTSAAGLATGDLWNNSGVINIA